MCKLLNKCLIKCLYSSLLRVFVPFLTFKFYVTPKGNALEPVASRCIIPMPRQRNNASGRHRTRWIGTSPMRKLLNKKTCLNIAKPMQFYWVIYRKMKMRSESGLPDFSCSWEVLLFDNIVGVAHPPLWQPCKINALAAINSGTKVSLDWLLSQST